MLGDETARLETAAALASARGLIRSEVGKALGLRLTPSLEFQLDELPEGVHRIEDALREAAAHDAAIASLAAGASYAGSPDPYKHSQDEDLVAGGESADDATSDSGRTGESGDGTASGSPN